MASLLTTWASSKEFKILPPGWRLVIGILHHHSYSLNCIGFQYPLALTSKFPPSLINCSLTISLLTFVHFFSHLFPAEQPGPLRSNFWLSLAHAHRLVLVLSACARQKFEIQYYSVSVSLHHFPLSNVISSLTFS